MPVLPFAEPGQSLTLEAAAEVLLKAKATLQG